MPQAWIMRRATTRSGSGKRIEPRFRLDGRERLPIDLRRVLDVVAGHGSQARSPLFVMVVLGTTIHEFARNSTLSPHDTRGWSDQVRP